MNTLGGSRGERNAKPKYAALDINRMYKNSRGESAEPSAQKNQVPIKHGMQSLGKVPSARRPPANLPSLKAETINSPNTHNTKATPGQDAGPPTSGQNSVQVKGAGTTAKQQHTPTTALLKNSNKSNLSNINNNSVVGGIGSKLVNNSASNTNPRNSTSSATANSHSSQSSITWSAVTTGNDSTNKGGGGGGKSSVPPLYQSPQFQHEFPTLDGTVGGGGSGGGVGASSSANKKDQHHHHNHQGYRDHHQHHQHYPQHALNHPHQRDYQHGRNMDQRYDHLHHQHQQLHQHNYRDGNDGEENQQRDFGEISTHSQNDAQIWLQQHEKMGKVDIDNALNQPGQGLQTVGTSGGNGTPGTTSAAVPPPILALMPSFMQRGAPPSAGSSSAGVGRSQTPPNYPNGTCKDSIAGSSASTRQQRPQDYNLNSQVASGGNGGGYRQGLGLPKRPPLLNTPPLGGQATNGARKDKEFVVEPEVVQMQRPIIREEELERLNAIAKDDSWTRTDEIDYNKKFAFSDDESPEESTPTLERDRPVFNKGGATEHRKNSNSSSGGNNWQRNNKEQKRDSAEREKSGEKEEVRQQQQQNGHRGSVVGSALEAVYERVKQRKEEEERREMERKQAANKKLQELEMKLNSKKVNPINSSNLVTLGGSNATTPCGAGDSIEQPFCSVGSDEDYQMSQRRVDRSGVTGGRISDYDQQRSRGFEAQRDSRGGGDYARERASIGNLTANGAQPSSKSMFSAHFQSNLPPRFQRQQQMQTIGNGNSGMQASTANNNARSITANNVPQVGGIEKSNSTSSTSFDGAGRYIQKVGSGGQSQQQQIQRGGRGSDFRDRDFNRSFGRNRNDSEREDDRYHSGGTRREDYARSAGLNQHNLSRSISDTSQRKTSVSSNDDSIKYAAADSSGGGKDFGNVSIGTSWAEETDAELKRQRDESFSSSHSHESIPIKILQRPLTQKSVSEEENMPVTQEQQHHQQTQSQHYSQQSRKNECELSHFAPTQILRRSESSDEKIQSVNVNATHISTTISSTTPTVLGQKSSSVSPPKQLEASCNDATNSKRKESESSNAGAGSAVNVVPSTCKESISEDKRGDDNRQQQITQRDVKRPSPRSVGERDRDVRAPHPRSYKNTYRGGRDGGSRDGGVGSWSRRGGANARSIAGGERGRNFQNEWSESENSEDIEDDNFGRRSDRSLKGSRKEQIGRDNRDQRRSGGADQGDERNTKEGFAPRGEPSRRGRGGSGNVNDRSSVGVGNASLTYRRDGRISSGSNQGGRQYGRQSFDETKDKKNSESEHSTSTEIDKTKQNQIALSAGLNKAKDIGDEKKQSEIKTKQLSPQPTPVCQPTKKVNCDEGGNEKNLSNALPKQFGTSKESTISSRNEDVPAISDREKISALKEKDIPSGAAPHQQRNSSAGQRGVGSVATGSVNTKKPDLPIASLTSVQHSSTKPQQLAQTVTKPPPGLGCANFNSTTSITGSSNCNKIMQQQSQLSHPSQDLLKTKSEMILSPCENTTNGHNRGGSIQSLPQRSTSSSNSESEKSKVTTGEKVASNSLILDGAPVNTIIFENTNYKQQAQAAATSSASGTHLKRSTEPSMVDSSAASGANVSPVEQLSNALTQMSFSKDSNSASTVVSASTSDYEKDIKLGFSFGDATESYTSATKAVSESELKPRNLQQQQSPSTANVGQQHHQQQQHQQQQHQQQQHQQQQHQQQQQNIISTADLNMKIASVKKVWESVSPMSAEANSAMQQQQAVVAAAAAVAQQQQQQQLEVVDMTAASFVAAAVAASQQQQQQQQQQHMPHYAVTAVHMQQHHHSLSSPGPVPNAYGSHGSPFDSSQLEQQFGQAVHTKEGTVVGSGDDASYPSSQQQPASQQQQSMTGVMKHPDVVKQQNSAVKQMQHHPSMGMSPPPNLQPQQQHQQSAAQLHTAPQTFYQPSPQFTGIPTIPSPPAVVFNSSQMPPPPSQGGLYASFHSLDHSSRSQFSAAAAHTFPGHYNAAAAAGGPFNTFAMQTPPNLQTAPTPEMYSNITSQFRMGGGPSPFGNPNSQQLSNPNAAVAIISSNSNSLMPSVASVKPPPSSQQLGTIGSKGSGGGGPYPAATQQYMNLYPGPHPSQHPQGGPPGAHQLQSNSYYSNSAGGPNGPTFYGGPPQQGNGAGAQNYGLAAAAAAGLYGGHAGHQSVPPGSGGPQGPPPQSQHTMGSFNAQFMNSPLLTAAAMNQFRGAPTPQQQAQAAAAYMKSNQGQTHLDSMGRQLKSPLGADVSLNLAKQVQSQPSPPHHKNYGGWDLQNQALQQQVQQQQQQQRGVGVNQPNINTGNRQGGGGPPGGQGQGRYPTPIQRPTNYPQHPQGPPQSQQQQQQQNPQQGQQRSLRQSGGGNGGPQGGGGGPGGSNIGPGGNNNVGGVNGNSGQQQQINKPPYYANNGGGGGANRDTSHSHSAYFSGAGH